MAGIRFAKLVDSFVDLLERSGATVLRAEERQAIRPARMRVITGNAITDCILFLWTITPGGGPAGVRPDHERRVQITNARDFPFEPGQLTLLGGWSEEFGVYAFWDPRRHTRFAKGSPSLQVQSKTLENASRVGISTQCRPVAEGDEVIVAVAPDSLLWYIEAGQLLHGSEADSIGVQQLAEFVPDITNEERNFIDESQDESQASRRYELVTAMRAYRESKFRPAVLRAYRFQCAVCQCALKLVDAAHIVPVSYPQSTDDVTNGIALCRLHHGAYDNGLLGVRSDYGIITNVNQEHRLAELTMDMGLEQFKRQLPPKITVPNVIEVRPKPQNLILGLKARNWPAADCA